MSAKSDGVIGFTLYFVAMGYFFTTSTSLELMNEQVRITLVLYFFFFALFDILIAAIKPKAMAIYDF